MVIFLSGDGNWYLPGGIIGKINTDNSSTLVRLFNIREDPIETIDESSNDPFLVNCMLTRMSEFMPAAQKVYFPDMDKWANPEYFGGKFRSWANDDTPIGHPPSH